ncbi:MAG: preprotein translocase subunit YajC [bacterium]|nr:preprotein translocase subunit YajC [Gemmatimonadota bacterium]
MNEWLLLMGGRPPAGDPGSSGGFLFVVPLLIIMVIYWVILIRPQQKQAQTHQKLLDSLKKGDEVVTESGLVGTIASLQDDWVVLKADDNVKLRFLKSKIITTTAAIAAAKEREGKKK